MARNELRFGILGPLEISAGFRSLPLGTPKQRAVLATLIIHRNRPVGIDSLIDAAWEQDRPEGSRATVYTYVSNLRRLVSTTGRIRTASWLAHRQGIDSPLPITNMMWHVLSAKGRPGCAPPLPVLSNRPVTICRPRWPSGAARSWTICVNSALSPAWPTHWLKTKSSPTQLSRRLKSPAGVPIQ